MKHYILLLIISFLTSAVHAQENKMSTELQTHLSKATEQNRLEITVVLTDQVDAEALKAEIDREQVPVEERGRIVMRRFQELAAATQAPLLSIIDQYGYLSDDVDPFWLVNMITLKASPTLIKLLAAHPNVEHVELTDERTIYLIEPVQAGAERGGDGPEVVNGVEPGLLVINAHKLWEMGYTGRGTRGFSIDTGVFPEHPAISDNWLGNRVPLNEAYFSFDFELPRDKNSSHGTHTIGTTLGLDRANNDTIGVAFNAYFIASDPVGGNPIKPLTLTIKAFEWAFNPDGDTTTTHDQPDVINNSWGYDDYDTVWCNSFVANVMTALEAAGTAVVFSAGNEGPAPYTITRPHFINTGLVNIMSVGAVDGNDTSLPVAGFSSRGPSICGKTGALLIKPEVVAPGVNVRSAVGVDDYAAYSGTSMSAPHVSGAVLLLKEAFPYLPGEELKLALYHTARDLGAPGEDNDYGNGLIDVFAAYNYLAQTNTPVPPVARDYDISVVDILLPDAEPYTCADTISGKVVLKNEGTQPETVQALLVESAQTALVLQNKTILPGDVDTLSFAGVILNGTGLQHFRIQALTDHYSTEWDTINNARFRYVNVLNNVSLPFADEFEHSLVFSDWIITNEDKSNTWDTLHNSSRPGSDVVVVMPFYQYLPRAGQRDELVSPVFELDAGKNYALEFDYSYYTSNSFFKDSLIIEASTDCGETYPHLLWQNGSTDLNTTTKRTPEDTSDWAQVAVALNHLAGNNVVIRFTGVNDRGGDLYLDNVRIFDAALATVDKLEQLGLKVFPNPVVEKVQVSWDAKGSARVIITDLMGQQLAAMEVSGGATTLDLSNYPAGVYFVSIASDAEIATKKVIKR